MQDTKRGFEDLYGDVIKQGLCCSCGTCVGICPTQALAMFYGASPLYDEEPQPIVDREKCNDCGLCYDTCPGKEIPLPNLDTFIFGRKRDLENEPLGIYREIYEGYAKNLDLRRKGASGGSVTALLAYALDHGVLDGVIVAANDPQRPWRIVPTIATTVEELTHTMSTKHCLVPINAALREAVVERGLQKVGVVGCPCHIEAIRKIQMASKPRKIAEAVALTVSLYCATNFWWEATRHMLFEEFGVSDLNEVKGFVYRGGGRPQDCIVTLADGTKRAVSLFSTFFNYLFPFQSERCSTCYDWAGELADISFGDLYVSFFLRPNELGWNSMVARTQTGENLLLEAAKKDYLFVRRSVAEYTIACFGIECKKHGSAHNLTWRKRHGWVVPDFGYDPGIPKPWPDKCRNANLQVDASYFEGV